VTASLSTRRGVHRCERESTVRNARVSGCGAGATAVPRFCL